MGRDRSTRPESAGHARIVQLDLGRVTLPDSHPRAAAGTCQINAFAISTADGVVVVDTGPRSGHPVIDQLYAPEVSSIVEVLNHHLIDERQVMAVVNTHLHFDHCGQNHLLASAPVWVTEAEVNTAATTEFYTVEEWADIAPDRLRLAGDGETIGPGVRLLHTPGHTPGHLSVAIDTEAGPEIIVGQACYSCDEFESGRPAVSDMHDPHWVDVGAESLARLRALEPIAAHFSHDPTVFRR